jgi:hypothetical protein
MDDKENINQQTMLDAIDDVSEKYDKTSRFLLKHFKNRRFISSTRTLYQKLVMR